VKNLDRGFIVIQGGTIEATGPSSNKAIYNGADGVVTIEGTFPVSSYEYGAPAVPGTRVAVTGGDSCYAVWNNASTNQGPIFPVSGYSSTGDSVIIAGGLVAGTSTSTVRNNSNGGITIMFKEGAIATEDVIPWVRATSGAAIDNNGTGTITITGGKISAGEAAEGEDEEDVDRPGVAIFNNSFGKINIGVTSSDVLLITSRNPNKSEGTIYFNSTQGDTKSELTITGTANAEIDNTANGGNVIFQESHGYITIGGGFAGKLGVNKVGMPSVEPSGSYQKGYALMVTNISARDFVTIGSNPPIIGGATRQTCSLNTSSSRNRIGVVKGTNYQTYDVPFTTSDTKIEEP